MTYFSGYICNKGYYLERNSQQLFSTRPCGAQLVDWSVCHWNDQIQRKTPSDNREKCGICMPVMPWCDVQKCALPSFCGWKDIRQNRKGNTVDDLMRIKSRLHILDLKSPRKQLNHDTRKSMGDLMSYSILHPDITTTSHLSIVWGIQHAMDKHLHNGRNTLSRLNNRGPEDRNWGIIGSNLDIIGHAEWAVVFGGRGV